MGLVVAAGIALILFQFRLDEIELLLAHDRWNLGDDNPFLGWQAIKTAVAPTNGLEWRDPLCRRAIVIAPGVDRARVDRIGQDATDGTITPMRAATWTSYPKVGQMFCQATQGVSFLLIVAEHLGHQSCFYFGEPHSCWIA